MSDLVEDLKASGCALKGVLPLVIGYGVGTLPL